MTPTSYQAALSDVFFPQCNRVTELPCVAQNVGLLVLGLAARCPHTPSTQHQNYQVHTGPTTSISLPQLKLPAELLGGY